MEYLLIFIGGGFGSICRYALGHLLTSSHPVFPLGTFGANIVSCIILGFLLGLNMKGAIPNAYRMLLMTGFCGGFSTFSTFSGETLLLFQSGHPGYALLNIGGSVVVCLFCIFLGIKLSGMG